VTLWKRFLLNYPRLHDTAPSTFPMTVDERRGKGKRGGIRIIYYWWKTESEFYLFTLYDKDQASDLTKEQRQTLRHALERIKGE
jgi:hypothetical protein